MKKIFIIIVFLLIYVPLFAIDYITSPLISGIYEDVVIKNNTAYLANQWSVLIYDVTDKTDPIIKKIIPFNMALYLGIQDDLLFVSTLVSTFGTYENRTAIYDISSLYDPVFISEVEESAQRFVVRDTLLFMQTQEVIDDELLYKLKIFNISESYYPSQIAEIDSVKSFDFYNDYLYTANTIYTESEIHLSIYNVEDVENITLLNQVGLQINHTSNNDPYLLIDGNIIYIGEWNSLYVLNINDPILPEILSYMDCISLMDWYNKILKYNTYLFLNGGKIVEVSNPGNPQIVGNYDPPWPPGNVITSMFSYDGYLYVTNWEYGYYILDLSNPLQPVQTYWYESTDNYSGVDLKNDYAYISSSQGVTILNISIPEDSYVIGSYPYIQWSEDICVDGDFAYIACAYGLVVLNISDPGNLYPVGDYQGCITRLAKRDDLVFAVDNIWGILRVYDVENLNNIQYLGVYDFADNPNALCIKDDVLFIADANEHNYLTQYNGGLRIIDISDPYNLELIATINPDTTRYYRSIAAKDDYVFMGSNEAGIYVFDVSSPMQPEQINYIESNRSSIDMKIQNEYLYNGVQIFDISDIFNVVLIDSCTSVCGSGIPWSIDVNGNYIYDASIHSVNIYYSEMITDIDEEINEYTSSHVVLYQNYPNPFISSTTIPFKLKNRSHVNLSIYNIKGELIETLVNETVNSGNNKIIWNSNNLFSPAGEKVLSNGIYFCKLQADGRVSVKKMVLMNMKVR